MATTEYPFGFQEFGVDVPPFMEERGFGGSGHFGIDPNHLHLPSVLSQWSTTDPTIFQVSDLSPSWSSCKGRVQCFPSSGLYSNVCAATSQRAGNNEGGGSPYDSSISNEDLPLGRDFYPLMHQMLLNHIERGNGPEHLPQLVSEQPPPGLYTSSSECLQDADSSGSSGPRDYSLPSSAVTACSSDDISWRNSDVVQGNFAPSSGGFHIEELYDDSSSPAEGPISSHTLRGGMSRPTSASWGLSGPESDAGLSAMATLDPLLGTLQDFNGPSPSHLQPSYKRPRPSAGFASSELGVGDSGGSLQGCYSSSLPIASTSSRPQLAQGRSMLGCGRVSCEYPMTSVNVADALYRDLQFSNRQQMCPGGHSFQPKNQTITPMGQDPCLDRISGRYLPRKEMPPLLENDLSRTTTTTLSRKQTATSIEPQSVAARHRRKKISERVKVLEELIPGGNKMDTASMLDEAIEYVKFLQLQVSLLEKLGEAPDATNGRSSPSAAAAFHGSSRGARGCPPMPLTASSPLILSEILQEQLFKQKLCLVSLRQYSSASGSPSGSHA